MRRLTFSALVLSLLFTGCAKKDNSQNTQSGQSGAQTSTQQPNSPSGTPASVTPGANPQNSAAAVSTPNPAPPAPTREFNDADSGKAGAAAPAAPTAITIPAGTTISVHLDNAISTATAQPGQEFSASVSRASRGIPPGSRASGTIVNAASAGRFKGGAVLTLRLNRLTINGQPYQVSTAPLSMTSKARGKRTAIVTGGGAAVGALIGGLAGGGKGALIGTLAGGGAGAAGSAFTGNREIALPAEATLSFRLSRSVTLR